MCFNDFSKTQIFVPFYFKILTIYIAIGNSKNINLGEVVMENKLTKFKEENNVLSINDLCKKLNLSRKKSWKFDKTK